MLFRSGIGLAALAIKAANIAMQRRTLAETALPPIPDGGQDPLEAESLMASLANEDRDETYLVRRLREALDFVVRTGTADDLEGHLKYLSDVDAARAAQGYGLVRFVIWAIPIMGFLGTVIGITVAIANLSPTQLENISGVVAGLGTAFDTTATALGLSMVLMFVQFVVDRAEQSLLSDVDAVAWDSLAGRFHQTSGLGATTLAGAFGAAGDTLRASLEGSVRAALAGWRDSLLEAQSSLAAQREDRWLAAAESVATAVKTVEQQQRTLAIQTELLADVVSATRDLTGLEKALNDNLSTLTTSGRFEEVLGTLAAATQLLAARSAAGPRAVDLSASRSFGKAA